MFLVKIINYMTYRDLKIWLIIAKITLFASTMQSLSFYTYHSSEIRSLCFMKWLSQMLQNSSIIGNPKTQVAFFVMAYVFCLLTAPRNENWI